MLRTDPDWVDDEARSVCAFQSCHLSFNFFRRRHHCRNCGDVFCNAHAPFDRERRMRVCEQCVLNTFERESMAVLDAPIPSATAPPQARAPSPPPQPAPPEPRAAEEASRTDKQVELERTHAELEEAHNALIRAGSGSSNSLDHIIELSLIEAKLEAARIALAEYRSREDHEAAASGPLMLSEPCPICGEIEGEAFAPAACGHCLCRSCAVRYVRLALGDARTSVFAEGLRCPQHPSGCSAHVTLADAFKLLHDEPEACSCGGSASADEPSLPEEHLLPKELDLLTRFAVEAAVPDCDKMFCPSCEQVLLRNGEAEQWVQCPHCAHSWNATTHAGADAATDAFLRATSKPCPNCSMRTTHYHGHACHHIGYGTQGCPQCRQHWCYVCERKHGTPQGDGTPTAFTTMSNSKNRDCRHGSSFCENEGILQHLRREPYPHDDRCGCPVCPNCRPDAPCEQCDGGCVVCQGVVEPGPSELAA